MLVRTCWRLAIVLIVLIQATLVHGATVEEVVKSLRGLSPVQRKATLEEGARKEGETIWYTSMSLTDFPKIVGAFEKTVPYVKVRVNRLSQSSIMPKIDTEARAGLFAVDVVGSAPMEMWELKQRGYSAAYLSPELKTFPAGAYDPQGFWASTEVTPLVLAFNTHLVPPGEAPRSYQDLLLPKWKGKMNFGSDEYAWYSVMLDGMGKAKGLDFMRALARQQLHIPGGSSIMRLQLMLAGESAIAIAARGRRATEYKEKGAPIDYRLLDPYPAEPTPSADAPFWASSRVDSVYRLDAVGRRPDCTGAADSANHTCAKGSSKFRGIRSFIKKILYSLTPHSSDPISTS